MPCLPALPARETSHRGSVRAVRAAGGACTEACRAAIGVLNQRSLHARTQVVLFADFAADVYVSSNASSSSHRRSLAAATPDYTHAMMSYTAVVQVSHWRAATVTPISLIFMYSRHHSCSNIVNVHVQAIGPPAAVQCNQLPMN